MVKNIETVGRAPITDEERWAVVLSSLRGDVPAKIADTASLRKKLKNLKNLKLPDYPDAFALNPDVSGKDGAHGGVGGL